MFPSPRSRLALLLLTVLFAYNLTAVLSTAGATDASDETDTTATEEVAVVEEAAPVEEAATAEVATEVAPAEEATEVAQAGEEATEEASAEEAETFIEPVADRASAYAKAKSASKTVSKFSTRVTRTRRAARTSAPSRIAAAGDWKILLPGSQTEVNNNAPHQGVCNFDIQWDGYDANTVYTYGFTNQSPPFPVIAGVSGQVTTNKDGFAKASIEFNPTNLAGLTLGAQGYHVKGEESGGKQKTFWVDEACAQSLAVKKVTTGTNPPNDSFSFTGAAGTPTLQNGQTSTPVSLLGGPVTITETQTTSNAGTWTLTGASCVDTANQNAPVASQLNGMTVSLTVGAGKAVVCTFTNNFTPAPNAPTLAVKKVTTGSGPNDTFNFTGNAGTPSLTNGQTSSAVTIAAGQVSITETQATSNVGTWSLTGVDCVDIANNNAVVASSLNGMTATLTAANNQTIVCTFTNNFTRGSSTLTVAKSVTSSGTLGGYVPTSESFAFSGDAGSPALTHGQTGSPQTITVPATGLVIDEAIENEATGWSLQSVSCVDTANNNAAVADVENLLAGTATLDISATGMAVVCTFNNHFQGGSPGTPGGTIIVDKVTDPAGSTESFGFTLTPAGGTAIPFSLTDTAAPFSSNQPVGTYSVAETVPAGWDLTSATCSDGSPASAIALGSAETVTCTFTNTLQRGTITVIKDAIPLTTSDQTFLFTGDVVAELGDGDSAGETVLPGTYTVTEQTNEDWELTTIDCTDPTSDSSGDVSSATATFVVDPGEDVVCEFTNVEEEVKGGNIPGPGKPGADDETPEVKERRAEALPLTGSEPIRFIALAGLLLLSGAIATGYARRRGN